MEAIFMKNHTNLAAKRGFTLIELATVLAIISVLVSIAMATVWDTESGDAAIVRSVQTQLRVGASQTAMQTGDLVNDDGNLTTLATYIANQMDATAGVTFACGIAGPGECRLSFKDKLVYCRVNPNGSVELFDLSGFRKYTVVDGELVRS